MFVNHFHSSLDDSLDELEGNGTAQLTACYAQDRISARGRFTEVDAVDIIRKILVSPHPLASSTLLKLIPGRTVSNICTSTE